MKANFVMDALVGLMASKALPVVISGDIEEISKKQLANVQGIVVTSNMDEVSMVFEDGSAITKQGNKVFIADAKTVVKHPIVKKTTALKAFVK